MASLTSHLYIFGTAGEGYAVTDRQFEAVTNVFVEEVRAANGVPMVGVISLSLGTILERIEFASALGVREFQISLPCWGTLDDGEVERFFEETCGRFPEARFLHYNLSRARRVLTGHDYARLAARHRNLVAVKMGGEISALADVLRSAPMLRCFFTEFAFAALGDAPNIGLLCALGACEPSLARQFFAADPSSRREFEPTFRALHAAVKNAIGAKAHMDGAYDKMYVKLQCPEFPLRLLPPYASATDAQFEQFRATAFALLNRTPAPAFSPS